VPGTFGLETLQQLSVAVRLTLFSIEVTTTFCHRLPLADMQLAALREIQLRN